MPSVRPSLPSPLQVTGYAALQVLLAIVTIPLFVLCAVAGVVAIAWVGVPMLVVLIPLARRLATWHREVAAGTLGLPVEDVYAPTDGLGTMARLRVWVMDPMTWRDFGWMVVSVTVGFALSLLTVLLLLLVVTGLIWWFGAVPIMQARSRIDLSLLTRGRTERLEERVHVLTETRSQSIDHSAAELRRIERDLHDGAQARLVALGMTLGLAEELVERDPEAAIALLSEARSSTGTALQELRQVVRGMHPPVLADRGLGGAVEALALDMAVPVQVHNRLSERVPAPIESAIYFAVAECLANTGKHANASYGWIELSREGYLLRAVVGDDGDGGAAPDRGTGLRGVAQRLAAFDGTMRVHSPVGGPTLITLEVPCDWSSPKTTPFSATD